MTIIADSQGIEIVAMYDNSDVPLRMKEHAGWGGARQESHSFEAVAVAILPDAPPISFPINTAHLFSDILFAQAHFTR